MLRTDWIKIALFGYLLFVLMGCNQVADPGESNDMAPSPSTIEPSDFSVPVTVYPVETVDTNVTIVPQAVASLDPALQEIVYLVMEDLNQRSGIDLEDIDLMELESIEWPDSNLGCGKPGEVYLPVITPGYRIVLEANGQSYSYHTNNSNLFILCDQPRPIMINPTP